MIMAEIAQTPSMKIVGDLAGELSHASIERISKEEYQGNDELLDCNGHDFALLS